MPEDAAMGVREPIRRNLYHQPSDSLSPNRKNHPYLWYTLLFLLCLAGLLFLMQDRSFIRKADANHQHYQAAAFFGWWLREGIRRILSGEGGFLPWSLQIGMGGDVITTLHYYALGDPLMLPSAFFTSQNTEYFYSFTVLFRLYLAGLSCLLFLRRRELSDSGSVLGAIIYVFSGYGMNPGVFHPFFAIPMVCFPLLLSGVEDVYCRRSYKLFILAVFLSAVSSLYFLYMLAIFTVLYAVMRYFTRDAERSAADFILRMLKFGGAAILGVCLAAPVFLPNALSILLSDRLSVVRERLSFYPLRYYQNIAAAMVEDFGLYYSYAAVSPVAVLMVLLLTAAPFPRYLAEKTALAALLLIALFPAAGAFLNGNAYATNRWIWALVLMLVWCTARVMTDLESLKTRNLLWGAALAAAYTALCLLPTNLRGPKIVIPLVLLWIGVLLLLLLSPQKKAPLLRGALTLLVIAGVLLGNWIRFHPDHGNLAVSYIKRGAAYMLHDPAFFQVLSDQPDRDSVRFEIYDEPYYVNDAMLHGLNGDSYYFSSNDSGTASFRRSQWTSNSLAQRYFGFDMREFLTLPMGVRYVVVPERDAQLRFYTYDTLVAEADGYAVYASDYALPLVYVYDAVLPESELPDVLQRQEALLQFAVVEDGVETRLPRAVPEYTYSRLDWSAGPGTDGVVLNGTDLVAEREGATLEIRFPAVSDTELCLLAEGVTYEEAEAGSTEVIVSVSDGLRTEDLTITTPLDNFYCGYEDYLINLGYLEGERDSLLLTFPQAGTYHFRSLSVASLPMEQLKDRALKLQQSGVEDSSVGDGTVEIELAREEPGLVCIAIPYSTGWQAAVDGEAVPILAVNNGLCGVEVPAGAHTVHMHYRTPWMREGFLLAGASLMLLCIWAVLDARKTKKRIG